MYHLVIFRLAKSGQFDFTLGRNKIFAFAFLIGSEPTVVCTGNLLEKEAKLIFITFILDNLFFFQKFLGASTKLRKAANIFVMSVRPSFSPSSWGGKKVAPPKRIFMKFGI